MCQISHSFRFLFKMAPGQKKQVFHFKKCNNPWGFHASAVHQVGPHAWSAINPRSPHAHAHRATTKTIRGADLATDSFPLNPQRPGGSLAPESGAKMRCIRTQPTSMQPHPWSHFTSRLWGNVRIRAYIHMHTNVHTYVQTRSHFISRPWGRFCRCVHRERWTR